jgi:SAM-dependent methyltransferase
MRRLRFLLPGAWLGAWLLGCTPSTDTPAPATPAEGGGANVEAERAPQDGEADEPEPGTPAPDDLSKGSGPTAGTTTPERVDIDINEDYIQQQNPKRWEGRFEREGREVFDRRDEILAKLELHEGMAVADVGAGTGLFTLAIAERVGSKGKVYAVDVQAYFLDHIGQKARKAELGNVTLVRAKQDSAKLPEGSVDLVLMVDSYHHVEQPAPYLASLKAALRPGGRLVVVDYIAIEGKTEKWMLEHVRASPTEFRAEIEGAGFRFVRAHEGVLEENFFFEFERP